MPRKIALDDFRFSGSSERVVGRDGELNASSKKDLFSQVGKLMQELSKGDVDPMTEADISAAEVEKAHRQMLAAAFKDNSELMQLGRDISSDLYITSNRAGFARRFMRFKTVEQGAVPRATLTRKDAVASIVTSTGAVETQFIRDNEYNPKEFYIEVRLFVGEREIQRNSGDLLQEKWEEGLEASMVAEDRKWLQLANSTVNVENEQSTVLGTLTVDALGAFRNSVERWGIPASYWLIANDLWTDIAADPGFQQIIDQVSKFELLKTGKLGSVLGMEIVTDGSRHPQHKVLGPGEMWIVGQDTEHGQMTDRGEMMVEPLTAAVTGVPGRGWHMTEILSMLIANPRSIAKGRRV